MLSKLKNITKNPVLFGTVIVTIGVFTASVFNYLLQVMLGRLLTISDYGTFTALLSFSNIIGAPAAVLTTSLIKISSSLKAEGRFDKLTSLYWRFGVLTIVIGIIIFILINIAERAFPGFFTFDSLFAKIAFAMAMGLAYINIPNNAYLQGLSRFKAFAFTTSMVGLLRFCVLVILAFIGLGLGGVYIGYVLVALTMYLVEYSLLKKNLQHPELVETKDTLKRLFTFGASVLFVNLGMTLLNNVDMILVKNFFHEDLVGYYAGAVTVSKILLFGASTITVVMFPQVSEAFSKGEDAFKKFSGFLGLQVFVTLSGIAIFSLFAPLITRIMFGQKFMPSVEYVPMFSVFAGVWVLINFMIMFFLAIGKTKVWLLQIPAIVLQAVLILIFHETLYQIIKVNIFVSVVLLTLIIMYYIKSKKDSAPAVASLT